MCPKGQECRVSRTLISESPDDDVVTEQCFLESFTNKCDKHSQRPRVLENLTSSSRDSKLTVNMPPIPVYTQSPITAAKPSGVTPKTASPDDNNDNSNAAPTPTTKQTKLPRYAPVQPPPTTTTPNDANPPPPQPGAVPRLPAVTSTSAPPPPQPSHRGTATSPPEPTPAPAFPGTGLPPQMAMPAPGMNYSHSQRGTASTGPPGYQQHQGGFAQNSSNLREGESGGAGADEGVWGSAVKLMQAAGKTLSDAESEVWRRINGGKE